MKPSLIISIVAAVISVGSLVFAVISFNKSHKVSKRQLKIEEAREEEKKKAYLTAQIIPRELKRSGTSRIIYKHDLLIENKGFAEARNIILLLESMPVLKNPVIQKAQKEIKQVAPQSSFRYEFSDDLVGCLPQRVEISWEDDSGEAGKYNTTLTL